MGNIEDICESRNIVSMIIQKQFIKRSTDNHKRCLILMYIYDTTFHTASAHIFFCRVDRCR